MKDLINKKCVPCEAGAPPLGVEEIKGYLSELKGGWELMENPPSPKATEGRLAKLKKQFRFADFKQAMGFVNKVADLAESEGHHPDISIHYNKVEISLWTHSVGGLSENDFILASKIDHIK